MCSGGSLERPERNTLIQASHTHVEHLGIFGVVGRRDGVGAWQVGVDGPGGLPPAVVFEKEDPAGTSSTWTCTNCGSPSCNHQTRLMKALGLADGGFPISFWG